MTPRVDFVLLSMFILVSFILVYGQQGDPIPANDHSKLKTLIVAPEAKSDSEVAVPPFTSVRVNLTPEKKLNAGTIDIRSWIAKEALLNGLNSADVPAWHIIVTYDQFDEDGDNVHSGSYEEFWAGEKKYKRIYKSDDFNQTDYGTDKGLFRLGDQQWANRAESQVRSEVVDPFYYAATLQGFHGRNVERTFSNYKLQCLFIERDSGISDPTQYCFEPDSSILRYSRGFGWFQTVYNRIGDFQGHNIAQEVDVTDGGKPYLKLRVERFEFLSHADDASFVPPRDAVGPLGDRISGVQLTPINMSSFPQ
jgi:hypothetical protein